MGRWSWAASITVVGLVGACGRSDVGDEDSDFGFEPAGGSGGQGGSSASGGVGGNARGSGGTSGSGVGAVGGSGGAGGASGAGAGGVSAGGSGGTGAVAGSGGGSGGTGARGVVCGTSSCAPCCDDVDGTPYCMALESMCPGGAVILCDGPEDCDAGETCCATLSRNRRRYLRTGCYSECSARDERVVCGVGGICPSGQACAASAAAPAYRDCQ